MKKSIKLISFLLSLFIIFASCSSAPKGEEQEETESKVINIAHTQSYYPYDFVDENGESDGFEVQVLKEVSKLLPQYTFKFTGTSDDDLLIGVETGKYDIGTKGIWYTEERAEKYIFPENNIAVSIIGITFRDENKDQIKDLESFAEFSGKLVPIAPQSAQWAVVEEYNNKNPDNQIELIPSESFVISDAYRWVIEGRYDAFFDIKLSYENSIVSEDGAYHDLSDKLAYVPYKAIPTWPLFNKENEQLSKEYDDAITQLRESGKLVELSQKYFGENIFEYETE